MGSDKLTETNHKEILLDNIVEELVRNKVNELIKSLNMCDCKICRLNACAIALNALDPKYVTTKKGALLAEIVTTHPDYQAQITVEVTKALMVVRDHPLH